ncbi:MAG: helix-turn-helix transcriptional regulator, partial [Methylococcaceae bacterium]
MAEHEKIKFIRQLKGWSQEDMAEKLAMSINGYGSIERGETNVNLSRLEQIAQLFGMELSELVALNEKSV